MIDPEGRFVFTPHSSTTCLRQGRSILAGFTMTMAVAAQALKAQHPAAVWLCAPVAPLSLLPWLQQWGDRMIVLKTPKSFFSVSSFYAEFPQVETESALAYLQQHNDSL